MECTRGGLATWAAFGSARYCARSYTSGDSGPHAPRKVRNDTGSVGTVAPEPSQNNGDKRAIQPCLEVGEPYFYQGGGYHVDHPIHSDGEVPPPESQCAVIPVEMEDYFGVAVDPRSGAHQFLGAAINLDFSSMED